MKQRFAYGGQAVIEGVMIRGAKFVSLAVRRPNGEIFTQCDPLAGLYTGKARRIPLVRGIVVLGETLQLGMKALNRSAIVATTQDAGKDGEPIKEPPKWLFSLTMLFSLAFGIAIFMVTPLALVHFLDPYIDRMFGTGAFADFASNMVEGLIRLAILVGYVGIIGLMPDIKRVYAYHGAEHMAVHAHENGDPLDVEHVRPYPTAHPRCGTAFLLTVMLVSVLVFAFLGRPPFLLRMLSRVALVPVIAAVAYEVIRWSGMYRKNPLVHLLTAPSLWLQQLTTRRPDDDQIRVAIRAMEVAVSADEGRAAPPGTPATPIAPEPTQPQATTTPTPPPSHLAPPEGPVPHRNLPSANGHQETTR